MNRNRLLSAIDNNQTHNFLLHRFSSIDSNLLLKSIVIDWNRLSLYRLTTSGELDTGASNKILVLKILIFVNPGSTKLNINFLFWKRKLRFEPIKLPYQKTLHSQRYHALCVVIITLITQFASLRFQSANTQNEFLFFRHNEIQVFLFPFLCCISPFFRRQANVRQKCGSWFQ